MNSSKPQVALNSLSKDHDESLKFCSRIRNGLSNKVKPERIRSYTDWFKKNYLERHFETEENLIFPVLGKNVRVKRAIANHRRIRKLLSCGCENEKVLHLLEEELSRYIRFEERTLYAEIKKLATAEQLFEFEKLHQNLHLPEEQWKDKFWLE
ncbi:hemerythrin domain-containing protein [Antarcticibacterium sp. 1MA-6-2]|uniref:hemerythrin domain-containing protein n=1 Tax=Antarcticibacterium sp. 1MA-6-2 TaxID=2908210 RepID=UPI001F421310|nr:hemerythrin domain-containing protein [Antarcticibacterium sp. 1MA-6-2]UJH92887.1 hemerythrin domain-containing protein [Antarcticibacterium sp. 1MA-6-2]